MPHHEHGLHGVRLSNLVLRQQGRIEPARARNAGRFHERLVDETGKHPVVVDLPNPAPMPPRLLGKTVIEGQSCYIETEIGRALYVVVAAEDVGATTAVTDIAGGEQQDAAGADVSCPGRVLSLAHRPDQR